MYGCPKPVTVTDKGMEIYLGNVYTVLRVTALDERNTQKNDTFYYKTPINNNNNNL